MDILLSQIPTLTDFSFFNVNGTFSIYFLNVS